jgi:hypothetical protein
MNQTLAANCALRCCNCCPSNSQCVDSGQPRRIAVSTAIRICEHWTVASRCKNRPEGRSTCRSTTEHCPPARWSASISAVTVRAATCVSVSKRVSSVAYGPMYRFRVFNNVGRTGGGLRTARTGPAPSQDADPARLDRLDQATSPMCGTALYQIISMEYKSVGMQQDVALSSCALDMSWRWTCGARAPPARLRKMLELS